MPLAAFDSHVWASVLSHLKVDDVIRLWVAGMPLQNALRAAFRDLDFVHPSSRPIGLIRTFDILEQLSAHPHSFTLSSARHDTPTTIERHVDWSFFAPTLQTLVLRLDSSAPLYSCFNPLDLPNLTSLEIGEIKGLSNTFGLPPSLTKLVIDSYAGTIPSQVLVALPSGLRVFDVNFPIALAPGHRLDWTHLPLEKVRIRLQFHYPIQWSFLPKSLTNLSATISFGSAAHLEALPPPLEGWNTLFPSLVALETFFTSLVYSAPKSVWNAYVTHVKAQHLKIDSAGYAAAFPSTIREIRAIPDFRVPVDPGPALVPLMEQLLIVSSQLRVMAGLNVCFPNVHQDALNFRSLVELDAPYRYNASDFSVAKYPSLKTLQSRLTVSEKELVSVCLPLPHSLTHFDASYIPKEYDFILEPIRTWPSTLTSLKVEVQVDALKTLDLNVLPSILKSFRFTAAKYHSEQRGTIGMIGSFLKFKNLELLELEAIVLDATSNTSENHFFEITRELPSALCQLTCIDVNINPLSFAHSALTSLEMLSVLGQVRFAGSLLDVASLVYLPRNLEYLAFGVAPKSDMITTSFIQSLPRSLACMEMRKCCNARWESDSAACLSYLPKRMQSLAMSLDAPRRTAATAAGSNALDSQQENDSPVYAFPIDLAELCPHYLRLRVDDANIQRRFDVARDDWLLVEKQYYLAEWKPQLFPVYFNYQTNDGKIHKFTYDFDSQEEDDEEDCLHHAKDGTLASLKTDATSLIYH